MILGLINLMINIYSDITNRQNEPTLHEERNDE